MVPTAPSSEGLYEVSRRQVQVKHAVKTALACCLAAGLSYVFRLSSGQLAPVFAFLLLTMGMPSPRFNWLLTQLGTAFSAIVSAVILVACRDAIFVFLAVTLLWIFTCLLFSNWFPLPATLGAMVAALGVFVFFQGTFGDTLTFYAAYELNFLFAGFSVVTVNTLLWPFTTQRVFLERLASVYARLEQDCRKAARSISSGESPPVEGPSQEWAPFRPLRQMLAPELRRARDTSNPFARMILASRSLNLRLWFFNQAIAPLPPAALPAETRRRLASFLDRCAQQLHALLEGALNRKPVPLADPTLREEVSSARWDAGRIPPPQPESSADAQPSQTDNAARLAVPGERIDGEGDVLVTHGVYASILHRMVQGLETATASHNALFASFRNGLAGEFVAILPIATGTRLFNVQSVRSSTKLVLILLLLLAEEGWLGFPGGSQVAFYATFFASTGNLGRQNKTDLVGLAGLLIGFAYGIVAAFLTSSMPHFLLLLALVFLGEFVANLAYQRLPRYGVAGFQAGLAIPFAYLATTGPEWGSFTAVRTRFWGLVVAGFAAVVVHAYLRPALPMQQLRALVAAALRDTAASLTQLFGASSISWQGAPPSLDETVTRARDLLDDARYLPGLEHADPAYNGILACLQEIDANMEYLHFLVGLEGEHPLRERFFEVIGDYQEQARRNVEAVAQQLQQSPSRATDVEPVRWEPDASGRWENASHGVVPPVNGEIDPQRPAVIARCLDQIASAVVRISRIAHEINVRNSGR